MSSYANKPVRTCSHSPVSIFQTRIEVSNDPLTIWIPSNFEVIATTVITLTKVNITGKLANLYLK